jgi:hypothetical protein
MILESGFQKAMKAKKIITTITSKIKCLDTTKNKIGITKKHNVLNDITSSENVLASYIAYITTKSNNITWFNCSCGLNGYRRFSFVMHDC